ncbi:MAG: hypothetical protein MUF83_20830 [Acidimicrobiales bacterium]|jgi:hypothetical protein|nr:hypothetical protein [Acidimicrobiales bacterium]
MKRRSNTATWDGAPERRVRVLLECPPESSPAIIADALERQGFEVRTCEGPDRRHACALLHDGACSLVDGADVVVNLLDGPDDDAGRVLGALTHERRPPGIVTTQSAMEVASGREVPAEAVLPQRLTVVQGSLSTARLVEAITRSLRAQQEPTPSWGDGFC